MARLLGFNKPKKEGGGAASSDQALRILEKSYLNRTPYGEFNTVDEVDGFLNALKGLPQTADVQEKVADLENKKLQISTKLDDILTEKNLFDNDLQEALSVAARNNYSNMKSLIGSYAAIYGDASEQYDSQVVARVSKRYGTTDSIPDETLAYRKEIEEKAKFYSQLFNAYNVRDPETGKVGMLNPDAFAVVVDTNPTNGSINKIDIIPSGKVDKNYMRTEVGMNVVEGVPGTALPMYLRTFDMGMTEGGRPLIGGQLGNIKFQGVTDAKEDEDVGGAGVGILKLQKKDVGFGSRLNFLSDTPAESVNRTLEKIQADGISLSDQSYKYDSNDVPNGTILKMGSRLFYNTNKPGEILEIAGKDGQEKFDNMNKYLQGIGKDPSAAANPYFVTKDFLYNGDGSYKVKGNIDQNYFSTQLPPTTQSTFNQGAPSVFGGAPESASAPAMATDSFFAGKTSTPSNVPVSSTAVNTPNKPDVQSDSSGGEASLGERVIDKGKSFFRNVYNKVVNAE